MSAVKSPHIFRGSTLEELIPQIRAELGADAVITRQRDGLKGGVAGFFQKQFVEVEAVPGDSPKAAPFTRARQEAAAKRTIDVYDEEEPRPETAPAPRDEAMAEGLQSPAIRAMLEQAAPFAQQLQAAEKVFEPMPVEAAPGPVAAPAVAPQPLVVRNTRPGAADAIERGLVDAGITPAIAASVVTEAVSHLAPLSPRTPLRKLVREALSRRIAVQPSWPRKGRTVGFVGSGGSGKTLCSARLAAAYAQGSDLPVVCISLRPNDGGAALRSLLEPAGVPVHAAATAAEARAHAAGVREHALVVIDTPSVSPGDQAAIAQLARELDEISVYELHLALPATAGAAAAGELVAELEPLGVSRVALTHADETRHVGAAVDLSLRTRIPFSFVGRGTQVPGGLEIADAQALAEQVVA
jgi:flagellar biosynthesis protein FlhF